MSEEEEFYSEEEEEEEPETNHSFDINLEAFFPSHEAYEKYQENIEEDKKYINDNFDVVSWRFNNPEYINKLNAEEVEKLIKEIESCRIDEEELRYMEMSPEEREKDRLEDERYCNWLMEKIEQRLAEKVKQKAEADKMLSTAFNAMALIGESVMPKDDQIIFKNMRKVSNTLEQYGMTPSNAKIASGVLGFFAICSKHEYPDAYKEWKRSRGIKDEETSEESTSE